MRLVSLFLVVLIYGLLAQLVWGQGGPQVNVIEETERLLEKAIQLNQQTDNLITSSQFAKAEILAARDLAIREQVLGPKHPLVASALNKLGWIQDELGKYADSMLLYERALKIREEVLGPVHEAVAQSLNNLATVSRELGLYDKARPMFERALHIDEEVLGPTHPRLATTLSNFGLLLREQGDYAGARSLYERALKIGEQSLGPDHPDVALSLNDLALLSYMQGDYVRAESLNKNALRIQEKALGLEHRSVARSFNDLAAVKFAQADYAAAESLFERALQIREIALGSTHPDVAQSLNNLAALRYARGDYVAAEPLYKRALQISEAVFGPTHPEVASNLNNLAVLLKEQGDYAAARPLYERALQIREQALGPTHPDVAISFSNLAFMDWKTHDLPQAQAQFLRASRIVDTQITELLPGLSFAEQMVFVEKNIPYNVSLLFSTHEETNDLSQVYDLILRWKGVLLEALKRQGAIAQLGRQLQFAGQVDQLQGTRGQLAALYHQGGRFSGDQWQARLVTLTQEKEVLERYLIKALPIGAREDVLAHEALQQVHRNLAVDETFVDVYRYFRFTEDRKNEAWHYAAVVTDVGSGPRLVELGLADQLEAAVVAWRESVQRGDRAGSEWQVLLDLIWTPINIALPKETNTVWVSPDGELNRIPWHVIAVADSKIPSIRVAQISSPRDFVKMRMRIPVDPAAATPTVFLAGGINFNAGRQAAAQDREPFPSLPGTKEEVDGLAGLAEREKFAVSVLTGATATKSRVKEKMGQVAYAHLATHGFFVAEADRPVGTEMASLRGAMLIEPDRPKPVRGNRKAAARNPLVESGIALAGANVRDPSNPEASGILTAEELVGLDLNHVDLITLSACETGRGEERTGQGVLGLQASIMAAGARSLLMSLWKVPDESTSMLMQAFYTNLWEKKLSKAESLKQAQATVREDPSGRFRAPIHWAGWVLVGEAW